MFEEKSQDIVRIMYLLDIIMTPGAFLVAYLLANTLLPNTEADFFSHVALLPLIVALLIFFLSYFNAYQGPRSSSVSAYIWSIFRGMVLTFGVLLTLLFLLKIQYVSRFVISIFACLDFLILISIRIFIHWYFKRSIKEGENLHKVLIIGTGHRAIHLSQTLIKLANWGIDIIGYLDPDPSKVGSKLLGYPVIGTAQDINSVLKNHVVDEVILAVPRNMIEDVYYIVDSCEEEGIKFRFMADLFDFQGAQASLFQLGEIPLLTLEPVPLDKTMLLVKRVFDLTFTLLSMPIVLPVMGIIAAAIKLDSPGPVFFVQKRVGLRKRIFLMFKFRSMFDGSEEKLKELEGLNEAEGPIFKITNDPRITPVGKFLRRTSLDELPQLFNVIRGEMSLVGPRPMSLRDVKLFDKGIQRKRFSVKPGLTCLWQISGRSNLPFSRWLELDLTYIGKWTLFLDFKILFKTILVVLKGTGAV